MGIDHEDVLLQEWSDSVTREHLLLIARKYRMELLRDGSSGAIRGVTLYSDHRIGELDAIVLQSTTEEYPAFCETFRPNFFRYEIRCPGSWLKDYL